MVQQTPRRDWLEVREVAQRCSVSERTVKKWIKTGLLEARLIPNMADGRRFTIRVSIDDYYAFVESWEPYQERSGN